jgi:bifunctional DNA-binding transcriptional regulator/antitoxin component of YhaV-PrlF toxin-antitoxin module
MTRTVLQIQSNGRISLPVSLRHRAKISKGEMMEATLSGDGTLCLKPRKGPESRFGDYLSQKWQNGGMLNEMNHTSMEEIFEDLDFTERNSP